MGDGDDFLTALRRMLVDAHAKLEGRKPMDFLIDPTIITGEPDPEIAMLWCDRKAGHRKPHRFVLRPIDDLYKWIFEVFAAIHPNSLSAMGWVIPAVLRQRLIDESMASRNRDTVYGKPEPRMTLGEAVDLLVTPAPCACAGPDPWPRCVCGQIVSEATELKRAAHIVAKLLAEVSE